MGMGDDMKDFGSMGSEKDLGLSTLRMATNFMELLCLESREDRGCICGVRDISMKEDSWEDERKGLGTGVLKMNTMLDSGD